MHKLLKILLAGLVCLGSMATAFADESAGVLPCTLTAENGTPVWQLSDQNRSTKLDWSGGTLTVESTEPTPGSISSGTVRPNPGPALPAASPSRVGNTASCMSISRWNPR